MKCWIFRIVEYNHKATTITLKKSGRFLLSRLPSKRLTMHAHSDVTTAGCSLVLFQRAAHLWIFGPGLCGAAGFTRQMHVRVCLNYHFNAISVLHTKRCAATA